MLKVSETLKACRKFRGWTQQKLSEKSGVDRAVISRYESGLSCPTVERFDDLMNAMGFTLEVSVIHETLHESQRR